METTEIWCEWCFLFSGKEWWCVREDFTVEVKDNWYTRDDKPPKKKEKLEPKWRSTGVEVQVTLNRQPEFRLWSTLHARVKKSYDIKGYTNLWVLSKDEWKQHKIPSLIFLMVSMDGDPYSSTVFHYLSQLLKNFFLTITRTHYVKGKSFF